MLLWEVVMLTSLKSIFAGTTVEFGSEEKTYAIPYALSLAIYADAYLTVESASVKISLTTPWARNYAQRFTNENNNRLKKAAEEIAEKIKELADKDQIDCEIRSEHLNYEEVLHAFISQSRNHDLSIIDTEQETMHFDRGIIESILIESGRPLIIVPEHWEQFKGDNIVVAWDGSGKAARAIGDSLAFLKNAKSITVVVVHETKKGDLVNSVKHLLSYLRRHSINAHARFENSEVNEISEVIREASKDADMLVMGAYAHSRIREYIFGGVTQSLLCEHKIPIFMSY